MRCLKCDYDNKAGRKFCSQCGSKLGWKCSTCGTINDQEDKFCGECGAKLKEAPESVIPKLEDMQDKLYIPEPLRQRRDMAQQELQGENRLVTALFADISGFTPLSNQHSTEKVVDVVNQCFKVIVDTVFRYEGDRNRFIGDNVLAFFGVPIAHENDPERAIMAALEIRDKVRELSLDVSIGINTGMMYFGTIGTREHHEVSAYGPDINLAKRLQEYAEPGQILVGSGTHRLTRKAFDFDVIQSLNLKGFDQPITAYSVQQMKLHPEKLRGIEGLRARMIGREHEFADVKEAMDDWLSGHGQIVSIIGEAGIGKSRLVSELKSYLTGKEDKQFQYIEGRCVSIGQPISYWPFIDILKTYFNLSEGDDTAAIARKVTESITELMPQGADETLPLLGQLLSIKFGNELDDRLKFATPEQIRHQTLMRLRDVFETLAKRQPLLLILEDLHWSDDLSLDLISLLMDELVNTPLMLLCVYRPEHDHRVWQLSSQARRKCMDRFTEIMLNPLSSIESRELIESLLEIENLPEPTKRMILERSEGNPFFIEEVIRSLIEQGMIYNEDERWKAKDEISSIDVPDTIQSVILSRVDRLQAEAKYVLQCASVIGRLFKYRLLEHLTHQERELNRYINEFEERELIYEERTVPELEYAFKHALTQEATYQSILERKRREFHLQVAQGIERLYQERLEEYYEELANHYSKSDDVEKAVEYLLKAGNKAKVSYANEIAISHFQKVLELLEQFRIEQNDWKLEALKGLGQTYLGMGKFTDAEKAFKNAIELAKNMNLSRNQFARLYHYTAESLFWQSRYDEVVKYGEKGLEILGDDTECLESALINEWIYLGIYNLGARKKALEYLSKNVALVKKLPYSPELREVYSDVIEFYFVHQENLDLDIAMFWANEFETHTEHHHDLAGLAEAFLYKAFVFRRQMKYEEALLYHQKCLTLSGNIGEARYLVWGHLGISSLLLSLGEIEKSAEHAVLMLENAERVSIPIDIARAHSLLGHTMMCQNHYDKAIYHYQEYLRFFQSIGRLSDVSAAHLLIGRASLKNNDCNTAIQSFIKSADIAIEELHKGSFDLRGEGVLQNAIAGIEEGYIISGNHSGFYEFCHEFGKKHCNAFEKLSLKQLHVEPGKIQEEFNHLVLLSGSETSWRWICEPHDHGCNYSFRSDGIEIIASNDRELYRLNIYAPHIMKEIPGEFAVEVSVSSASDDKPQMGGLLIWKDKHNFLRFEKGVDGKHEIRLQGFINDEYQIAGRGLLPESENNETYLRLERSGDEFTSYCNIDGENWLTCGKMTLPMEDPIQIGIHAIGMIDRTIYCGEYKEGTATLFRNFRIWKE